MSTPQQRLKNISSHLHAPEQASSRDVLFVKSPNDVVITLALRTALTRARKGAFKDTQLQDLLIPVLNSIRERSHLDPSLIDEITLGNVLHPSAHYLLRSSAIAASIPATTATSLVSRWCSSGLLAVQTIASQIRLGSIDIGIALGAESMSTTPDTGAPDLGPVIMAHETARDVAMPMGWTSENVAGEFNISREAQDAFAARSFQRAERAQKEGWTDDEIVPVRTTVINTVTKEVKTVMADRDDGVRSGTTKESLAKIRAAFPQWKPSTTTGGNASQITDGASGLLLMRRSVAEQLNQPILGRFVESVVVGLEPRIMGIGPSIAIPKLLGRLEVQIEDVDIFEINEAFASMAVYCVDKLKLDVEKVNPRGGAIAFGHPLGCTGARQIVTALSELKRTRKKVAVTSMCVGTGMGMAALIVSEQ